MAIIDRLTYALLGLLFGALIGVACWWLYGLAFSLNYQGPGLDPVLRHWVTWIGGAFSVLGFLLRERFGDFIGHTISVIFYFEADSARGSAASALLGLVFLALAIAAAWFTLPTQYSS